MALTKRKLIRITSAETLSGYQWRVVVYGIPGNDGVYSGENRIYLPEVNKDFSDIRFYSPSGTAYYAYLDYIEEDHAVFWVKIPSLLIGDNSLYVYYFDGVNNHPDYPYPIIPYGIEKRPYGSVRADGYTVILVDVTQDEAEALFHLGLLEERFTLTYVTGEYGVNYTTHTTTTATILWPVNEDCLILYDAATSPYVSGSPGGHTHEAEQKISVPYTEGNIVLLWHEIMHGQYTDPHAIYTESGTPVYDESSQDYADMITYLEHLGKSYVSDLINNLPMSEADNTEFQQLYYQMLEMVKLDFNDTLIFPVDSTYNNPLGTTVFDFIQIYNNGLQPTWVNDYTGSEYATLGTDDITVSGAGVMRSVLTHPVNKILTMYADITIVDGIVGIGVSDTSGNSAVFGATILQSPVVNTTETGSGGTYTRKSSTSDGEHCYEVVRTGSSVLFRVDQSQVAEHTATENISAGSLSIHYQNTGISSEVKISKVFIRQYAETEPIIKYTRTEDISTYPGWVSNLRNRRRIKITNGETTAYNQKIRIRVYRTTPSVSWGRWHSQIVLNSKCRSDFRDIQFSDEDGITILDNYLEVKGPNHADFVVKVPTLRAGTNYIYLYYNGERLRSDPVHSRFDDQIYDSFDQISPYTWGRNGNVSVDTSILTLQGTGASPYSQNYIRSVQSFSPGVRLVMRAKIGDPSGTYSGSEYSLIGFKGETTWDRLGITSLHRTAEWDDGRALPVFDEEYHIISLYWTEANYISMEIDSEHPFLDMRSPGSATMTVMLNAHQSFETIDVDWLFVAPCDNAYAVSIDPEEVLFLLQTPSFYWLGLQKVGEPIQFKLLNQNSFVSWDFGDGYISYESEPVHTYTASGTYTVTLKAADLDGNPQLTITDDIIISETEHYVIDFDASVRYGQYPLTVQFYNLSPDADSWLWDFGDGTTSTDQHPEHTYQDPQTFTVKLVSTTGTLVRSHIRENFIRVTELDIPEAGFTISPDIEYGTSPHTIQFTDTSTGTITDAYWDMDGEKVYETNPAYTFTRPGTAIIKRVVSNPDWTDELMTSLYIVPSGAIRIFATPLQGISGDEVQFKSFIALPYTKVSWNFGDGNTSDELSPVHTFTSAGTYTVTLSVWTGPILYPVTKTLSFVVIDESDLPDPEFSASVLSGNVPLEVTFTDLSTGDIDSWLWDFGDGNTSTDENPVHEYTTDGTFTVSLTVTNEYGSRVMTKYHYIRIYDTPEAAFSATYTGPSVTTPRPADLLPPFNGWTVAFQDLSTHTPSSWSWDFGDGSALSTIQNPTHVFSTIGKSYWVELTVTNAAGTDTIGMDITVLPTYFDVPNFTYTIQTHTSPYRVSFRVSSHTQGDMYLWDFGDGTTSTEQMPVKEYLFPGTYMVSFTRISSHGAITRKISLEVS